MPLVIGMNSGSSFDGIDAALLEINLGTDGSPMRPRFIDGITCDWPAEVQAIILKSFHNEIGVFELTRLNYVAGAVYAEVAKQLLDKCGLRPEEVTAIGFDGQTIYQEPPDHAGMGALTPEQGLVARWLNGPYPCGLQIGEPAIVAAHTNVTTVTHFRPADHALGGTGAPLMQYLDYVAFREIGPVLTLNIGGIANCQLANKDRSKMMAFDTGPGNVMLDHAAQRLFGKPIDADGAIAASGQVDQAMLADLLSHPYFHRHPPRSAWRLDFGADYADRMLEKWRQVKPADIMATFTAFAAAAIVKSIEDHIPNVQQLNVLIASGGGTRNQELMRVLAERLPGHMRLTMSDEFGIPARFKEAIKFGTLAYATVNHLANNIPAASGASQFAILGKIALPPRLARVSG